MLGGRLLGTAKCADQVSGLLSSVTHNSSNVVVLIRDPASPETTLLRAGDSDVVCFAFNRDESLLVHLPSTAHLCDERLGSIEF